MDRDKLTLEEIEALEERGWALDDAGLTADKAFDEFCEWNGLVRWGPKLRSVLAHYRAAST